jgi:ribosomal-protein-alanine N-acetyltransferase
MARRLFLIIGVMSKMICSERLNIRQHTIADLEWLSKLYSDEKAMYYLPYLLTKNIDTVKENLLKIIEEEQESKGRYKYFFCIELKREKNCIGEIGFTIVYKNDEKIADIGYFIFPEYWGKGYVTEAMNTVINFAFGKCNISRVIASCYKENVGSEKVMQKCKMQMIENSLHKRMHNDIEKDRVLYEITKQSFAFK